MKLLLWMLYSLFHFPFVFFLFHFPAEICTRYSSWETRAIQLKLLHNVQNGQDRNIWEDGW